MKIWEFFLCLLNHNFIDLVKWVNYGDGVFEIINKDDVAKMWGLTKKNYNMDYKKMSKTIRINYNYYSNHIHQNSFINLVKK